MKFWNPAVPMIVNRTDVLDGPATLTLYFRDDGAPPVKADITEVSSATDGSARAPPPREGEKTAVVDVKGLHSSEILAGLMEKTAAVQMHLTVKEEMELRDLQELRRRGEVDRKVNQKMQAELKREKARLAQAMSEAAAIRESAA